MADNKTVIEQLYAKEKTYKIPKEKIEGKDQVELKIKPLSMDDMELMNSDKSLEPSKIAKNTVKMIAKSLKLSEEEVSKISVEFLEDISSAIMDANNFKEEDLKKSVIKEFIQKKKEQMEDGKPTD